MTTVATIGHSNRSLAEFMAVLAAHNIEGVVDVRRSPFSRRHPHFNRDVLERTLDERRIRYTWLEALGGRRRRQANSPHTAWTDPALTAYADHTHTQTFVDAAEQVIAQAEKRTTAIMCAEANPLHCHRQLIADWMLVRGIEVIHLLSITETAGHRLNELARVDGDRIIYDRGQMSLLATAPLDP